MCLAQNTRVAAKAVKSPHHVLKTTPRSLKSDKGLPLHTQVATKTAQAAQNHKPCAATTATATVISQALLISNSKYSESQGDEASTHDTVALDDSSLQVPLGGIVHLPRDLKIQPRLENALHNSAIKPAWQDRDHTLPSTCVAVRCVGQRYQTPPLYVPFYPRSSPGSPQPSHSCVALEGPWPDSLFMPQL